MSFIHHLSIQLYIINYTSGFQCQRNVAFLLDQQSDKTFTWLFSQLLGENDGTYRVILVDIGRLNAEHPILGPWCLFTDAARLVVGGATVIRAVWLRPWLGCSWKQKMGRLHQGIVSTCMSLYIYIHGVYYTYTCMIYIYIALRVTRNETGAAAESQNTDLHMSHRWPPSSHRQRVCALCGGGLQRGIVGGWSSLLVQLCLLGWGVFIAFWYTCRLQQPFHFFAGWIIFSINNNAHIHIISLSK